MANKIIKEINDRTNFLSHLNNDIIKNEDLLKETQENLEKLQLAQKDIKFLSSYPEKEALIPLAENIYMNGKILHTGEYYIKHNVNQESYSVLKTLDQTLNYLEENIKAQNKIIENINKAKLQLNERKKILLGTHDDDVPLEDISNMPNEIKSEKGVALKVGDFYEILEYED